MRNANTTAAVSRHGPVFSVPATSRIAVPPANTARRPRALLTMAPAGRDTATADIPAAAGAAEPSRTAEDGRTGFLAACGAMARAAVTRLGAAMAARAEARARRIADRELTYLSDHILADMGLTRGRPRSQAA